MDRQEVKTKEDGMYYDAHGSKGPGVYCTCGAQKIHGRVKVLSKWAEKHLFKTGHRFIRTD